MSHLAHLAFGLVAFVLGFVLSLVGAQWLGAEHAQPISTGLMAIGAIAAAVGVAERRYGREREDAHR